MTVSGLCRRDPAWRVVEVDDHGRWKRVEQVLSTTSALGRVVVLAPDRRVDGLLVPDPARRVQGLLVSPDGVIIDETLGTEESVVGVVTRWVANIQAGRQWNARSRPLPLKDFLRDRAWTPQGERLHVLLTPSAQFRERITSLYGPVLEQRTDTLRVVPRERLHITLAWLDDLPSAELADDAVAAAVRAVEAVLATVSLEAFAEQDVLAADVAPYGVRCELADPKPINTLSAAVRAALTEVWPDATVKPAAGSDAHVALAYSTSTAADATELRDQLREAADGDPIGSRPDTWHIGRPDVRVVHVDTFGTDPWRWRSVTPR